MELLDFFRTNVPGFAQARITTAAQIGIRESRRIVGEYTLTADDVLGGSAVYFAASASHQTPVQLVGVVGDDFPVEKLEALVARVR